MNHALKKLLAALVACLMLLSSVAALANDYDGEWTTVEGNVTSSSGAGVNAMNDSRVTVNGNVTSTDGDGVVASDSTVSVTGDATGTASGVSATKNSYVEIQGKAQGDEIGVSASDGSMVHVDGGDAIGGKYYGVLANNDAAVFISGDAKSMGDYGVAVDAKGGAVVSVGGDAAGNKQGVKAEGNAWVWVNGTASATAENGNGVSAQGQGTEVTVGGATATGDYGHGVSAGDSATVTVDGVASAAGDFGHGVAAGDSASGTVNGDATSGSFGSGVLAYDGATVTVAGNAEGVSDGAYASGGSTVTVAGNAEGVYDGAYATGDGSKVTVHGDAIATGSSGSGAMAFDGGTITVDGNAEGAEGVYAYGDGTKVTVGRDATGDTGASVGRGSSVLVEGTIAGSSAGVNINCQNPEDLDDISVTAWKIDGDIQYNGSTDFDQSIGDKITKKVISYIIRVAEASGNVLNPDVVEGTDAVSDFKVAHEAEEVSAKLAGYNKGDKLEVYYNEDTKLSAGDYKVENGTLIVKMLPGGAMNLIAKIIEAEEKAEETAKKTTKKAATEFVYVPVDDNTAMNGVKAADHSGMADAVKTMGDSLGGEDVTVDILDKEKLMNGEELARFDKLSVKDRLLVVLKALGFGEALGGIEGEMSDEAAALSDDIAARVDALSDAEKQTLQDRLYSRFLPRLIVIDGQEYEAVGIEVVVTRDGVKSQARYTFYKDNGEWKLHQIEKGEYRAVNA